MPTSTTSSPGTCRRPGRFATPYGCGVTWKFSGCPRHLEVLGLSTAGLPTEATLYQAADIDRRTAEAYDRLLESLYLLDRLPAWSSNRLTRLVKRPKRYLTDPALAVSAARIDSTAVLRDGDLLGRVLDTFVTAQLRPEVALRQPRARLHHLRTESGRQEVDLIIDLGGGRVVGIEIKAASAPSIRDARHLLWLAEQLGERFVRGIVFHTPGRSRSNSATGSGRCRFAPCGRQRLPLGTTDRGPGRGGG